MTIFGGTTGGYWLVSIVSIAVLFIKQIFESGVKIRKYHKTCTLHGREGKYDGKRSGKEGLP